MPSSITQNLFVGDPTTITVVKCNDDAVNMQHLQPLLDAALADSVLAISACYADNCRLSLIAFSAQSHVLVMNVSNPARHIPQHVKQRIARGWRLLQDQLLLNPQFHKYALKMDQLAVALYLDLSIYINGAVDMLSVSTGGRHSLQALMDAMGGEAKLRKTNIKSLFFDTPAESAMDAAEVALQAWAVCKAATFPHMLPRFAPLPRIDTEALPKDHLVVLANISRNADRLEDLKPSISKNDVKEQFSMKKGIVNLSCDRFPTRIKQSRHQVIQIEIEGEESTSQVTGRTRRVEGRSVHININGPVQGDKIISVTTIGKEELTSAESTRQGIILKALQNKTNIISNPFFRALWLPKERPEWPKCKGQKHTLPVHFPRGLNPSQQAAVQRILSDEDDDRVVVIQGPPGTGKTTVIAASVISHRHANSNQRIWVAAQSNVAVKNIAEKFIKEDFRAFKILVSKDFHFDWHEHLYDGDLERCLIRSDRFKMSVVEASRMLLDCKVILCTLSMFSNPNIAVFLRIVPVETIILDEASQIECGDYLPIFHHFRPTLSKLVFIGDDKQLPPYGQEDIPELRSVFEFPHLRRRALFLDTQYRMPLVIGTFISRNVYGSKLGTCHLSTTSKPCRFIDVSRGQEVKAGHSWINREEARVVVSLVQLYVSKNFRIITPYDAQRSHIEKSLKLAQLPWEDKVFNVDSFQGNEDDHIIVSVVRSSRPGFLKNQRRTNVMLTRCKKTMVICSSRAFLLGRASDTLVGKLAAAIGDQGWINAKDRNGLQACRV